MLKLLIPTDGSEAAERAVQHAVTMFPLVCDMEVHLLNVQEPVDAWEVRRFLSDEEIENMQRQRAEESMEPACRILQSAGVKFHTYVAVGQVADVIAEFAVRLGCQQIVMGTHGMGAFEGLLMGATTTKVLHKVDVPVTLVK